VKRWFLCLILCSLLSPLSYTQEIPPEGVTIYVVQRGDSLYKLAQQYDVTIDELVILNALENRNVLKVGQRLLVPTTSVSSIPLSTQEPVFYVIASGETLFSIAQRYGVSLSLLAQANNIADPSLIYVGQRLIVPSSDFQLNETSSNALQLPEGIERIVFLSPVFTEGKTAIIEVITTDAVQLSATFLGQSIIAIPSGTATYRLLVAVPVFTPPGQVTLSLNIIRNGQSQNLDMPLIVVSGGYLTTNINVSPEQQALLSPAVEEFEISTLKNLTSRSNATRYHTGVFSLPAASPMNAPFGTRRSYNGGEVNRYHNGADFASAPSTPVYAAGSGQVVLADLLNIRGNTIVIDHGYGVYSLYAHLTAINVYLGQIISVGQAIGTSGSTGRVTGPHLHWEMWVNGIAVDPIQWTQSTFLTSE